MLKLDLEYFETVLFYKSLTDSVYLASIIDYVQPEFFTDNNKKAVFNIISEFYKKRGSSPNVTEIKTYLNTSELKENFRNIVETFKGLDTNFNQDELYQNTEQFLKEKAVYHTMIKTVDDISNNSIDTSEILQRFEKACNISLTQDLGIDLANDIELIEADLTKEVPYIKTGWPWLDGKLGGGYLRDGRAIYIFAGETNVGKSIVLGNTAVSIAKQNNTVLLISLEMSEMVYARRLCSNVTSIPISNLRHNISELKEKIKKHKEVHPEGRILIKEFPPSTITTNNLKAFIKKIISKNIRLDAIVIDYVNLLHSTVGNNSYERVKYCTEQLRALSYVFNCPVISATQLNRSGYDTNEPGLNTISESIGLAATADMICSVYKPDPENQENIISFGLMKNRFGINSGTQNMSVDYSTLTIIEDASINNTASGKSTADFLRTLNNEFTE